MATIDRIEELANQYKKQKKKKKNEDTVTQTSLTKIESLASEIESGNTNVIGDYLSTSAQWKRTYDQLKKKEEEQEEDKGFWSNLLTDTKAIGSNLLDSATSGILQFGKTIAMRNDETKNATNETFNDLNRLVIEQQAKKGASEKELKELEEALIRKPIDSTGFFQEKIDSLNQKMVETTETATNPVSKKIAGLSQSIGNNLVGAGLTAINPTAGLTYFVGSATGSYYDEGLQRGMTEEEAKLYGGIMGTLEGVTEKVLAGQNIKGFKAILEGQGFKNALKAFGIEVGENFIQEAAMPSLSEITAATTAGKDHLNYDFRTAKGWQDLGWDSLKDGFDGALSAILINGATKGVASATRVVNKMNNGQKVTQEEIATAVKDTQKTGVDVEGILQSELVRTAEKGLTQQQAQIEGLQQTIAKETEELNKAQDAREKQIRQEKINGLNEELNELTNAQTITDENELRKQNFTYQTQETDSDIRKAVYESASKVMNNTETTHKFVDVVAKIAEERGTTYKFTNNEQLKELGYTKDNATVNGLVNENNEVLINIDSAKMINTVVGHETTHLLEGTKEYEELKQVAIEYAKSKGDYDARIERLTKLYEGTNADIEAELTSDIVGEYLFTDENFVKELSVKQPTIFEKIRNFISDLVVKFAGTEQEKQLRQLQRTFEKAYKAQGTQTSTDTKYSTSEVFKDNRGKKLTKEQQDFFKDSKVRDENGNLLRVYHGSNADFTVFDNNKIGTATGMPMYGEGFYFTNKKSEAQDYGGNSAINKGKVYETYLDIKNPYMADAWKDVGALNKNKLIEQGYDGVIIKDGITTNYVVFNSNQIKNIDNTSPTKNPDIRYSLTDNQGRTLTKEQQEFFKDSKVRDENGNLLTMYHGTPNGGFTKFDINKRGTATDIHGTGDYGKGFYFTPVKEGAESYTKSDNVESKNPQVYETYLNLKNPLRLDILANIQKDIRALGKEYGMLNIPDIEIDKVYEKYNITEEQYDEMSTLYAKLGDNWQDIDISEYGYDGIINENRTEFVAFNSNQIKNIDNTKPTTDLDIRYSLSEDTDIDTKINSSMTMAEAKSMVERAFFANNIRDWYDGKYKTGVEWLEDVGVEEVGMYIENTYETQSKYINSNPDILNEEYTIEDVLQAYLDGTLIGKTQETSKRLDLSKDTGYKDDRFYAPKEYSNDVKLYKIASQRVTNANRSEVYKARADFIINAHNKGYAESLGLTQQEVNKKLKSWANYPKRAMDLSNSINEGVATQNRWAGIENSSIVNTISVSNEQMESLVKEVKGDSNGWQRKYITSTMLALDTHIDYTNLTIEFDQGAALREKHAAGDYNSETDTIRIGDAYQNTVAHEIGHYIDHLWAKELNLGSRLTDKHYLYDTAQTRLTEEQKTFTKNFDKFLNSIENSSDIRSKYTMSSNEVFARFVGKFTEWVKNQATSNRYGYEEKWYKDNFTESQYIEFARLLQEKSVLDAMDKSFKDDLRATIDAVKGNYSLSDQNEEIAPTGQWNVRGEDVKLQVEEAIAPLQEKIESLTEQLDTVVNSNKQPTMAEEITNLMNIKETQSGSDYARAFFDLRDKYGQPKLYKALNEYYKTGTVTEPNEFDNLAPTSQDIVEKQGQENFEHLPDDLIPPEIDETEFAPDEDTYEDVSSPVQERDIQEVGNRKVKAYQYEHPEVRPYFQAEADNMLGELSRRIEGERYPITGEDGYTVEWTGISRSIPEDIAYLKDNYGYSYEQIEKGLKAIIEDNGAENNAVSKRLEILIDERLTNGYTDFLEGYPIPPNQEYKNMLIENDAADYYSNLAKTLDDADIAPEQATMTVEPKTEVSQQVIPQQEKTAQKGNTEVKEGKQRKWVETSTESEVVNREILPDDLDQSKIFYQPITNKETLGTANARLSSLGYEKSVEYFNNQFLSKKTTVEDIALGERLIQEAIKKGDTKTAGDIIQNVAILGTELGQKVQALSIIQRMTPEGQLKMLEKTINRGKVKGDKAFTDIELTQKMKDKILKTYNKDGSYNQDKLNEVMDEVKQEIADQMQVTAMDKINAWRYLSMLGNPKTHIRNLVSNVAMKGTLKVKNAVARTIEDIAPIKNKTKTWKAASEEVTNFAKQTALEMKDVISGDSKYSESTDIKAKRKIFNTKFMNWLTDGNSNLLEKEDWWFSKGAFESSFREFLTANGISTQADIQNNPELIQKGKNYAVEQAQIATFRQYSWLANKIRDIESKNTATSIAVGAVLPFKKTPINIAKAGLNYSPLGFAKTLTYDISQVKKGNMEASTLIDHIAQNTTGTALTLVGYMLAQAGFLNGAGDDDKEGKYDYQLGKQAYSINIGGNTYSLSWLSPVAMPLFVGANAYEQLVEGEEWNTDVVLETLGQTLDPLSEMSFLSSLDSVLSSYDSGVQRFFGIGEAMAQNYITQFVPTVSSQLAATLDDTKRSTKVSGDSTMKVLEETYNKLIYKIPGLRETLEPTTDIWGNEVKQSENLFTRAFENFIAPYSRKDSIATDIDNELKDLYSQTGDNGLLPSIPYNYVNYDGEKYNMSAEEYTDFKKAYGQTANDLLEDLFRTTTYRNATSEERADMVNDVYDYARDEAKLDYLGKEGVDYTNATKEGEEYYKVNDIKGAIDNDMTVDEYRLYSEKPEKYNFFKNNGISYSDYDSNKDLYNYAYEHQDKYAASKAITGDFATYYSHIETMGDFDAKDEYGNSVNGLKKERVFNYVNSLDLDEIQKVIMFKMQYPKDDDYVGNGYNSAIVQYVGGLDMSYDEMVQVIEGLGMTVDSDGNVYW